MLKKNKEKKVKKDSKKKSSEDLVEEYLLGWKTCQAEFDNYKKRQAESNQDTVRYATENIVMQILPVIDNFSSSVDHIPEEQKEDPWVTGIMYIKKQLEDVLKENGVEEIEVKKGDDFDTKTCEAVLDKGCKSCKTKEKFKNKIEKVVLKGYRIGDKVIRPVKVTVK